MRFAESIAKEMGTERAYLSLNVFHSSSDLPHRSTSVDCSQNAYGIIVVRLLSRQQYFELPKADKMDTAIKECLITSKKTTFWDGQGEEGRASPGQNLGYPLWET